MIIFGPVKYLRSIYAAIWLTDLLFGNVGRKFDFIDAREIRKQRPQLRPW